MFESIFLQAQWNTDNQATSLAHGCTVTYCLFFLHQSLQNVFYREWSRDQFPQEPAPTLAAFQCQTSSEVPTYHIFLIPQWCPEPCAEQQQHKRCHTCLLTCTMCQNRKCIIQQHMNARYGHSVHTQLSQSTQLED